MPYKCRVCGRFIRSVYNHYGGQSCSACAAFFIRAINKGRKYNCGNQNMCLAIPSRSGTKCGKCRFKKCLEIGMRSTAATQNAADAATSKNLGKYLVIAKELYAMYTIITRDPLHLLKYFNRNEDTHLNEEASSLAKTLESTPTICKWAKIFQKNQIPFNEVHLLFYGIISSIKFPWLPINEQQAIAFIQNQALQVYLQPAAYSSAEIKEGFDKITAFFQKQYTKHFALKKLKENGQFHQIFSDVLSLDS